MIETLRKIITNVLTALYQPFWFAVILSILFMFAWKNYAHIKEALIKWIGWFKAEPLFRRMFFLVFYTAMILFRTLINRNMWLNPLQDVIGVWGLHKLDVHTNEMVFTTEVLENFALFIPFVLLLMLTYHDKLIGEKTTLWKILWKCSKIVFALHKKCQARERKNRLSKIIIDSNFPYQ